MALFHQKSVQVQCRACKNVSVMSVNINHPSKRDWWTMNFIFVFINLFFLRFHFLFLFLLFLRKLQNYVFLISFLLISACLNLHLTLSLVHPVFHVFFRRTQSLHGPSPVTTFGPKACMLQNPQAVM